MIEIERKFLLDEVPKMLDGIEGTDILQGYLMHEGSRETRIRRKGQNCFLTIKDGEGLSRLETEIMIANKDFATMWDLTKGRRLEKTRYELIFQGYLLEVDVFHGDLAPLCMVEVEFETEKASEKFQVPDWFGREVTNDPTFRNAYLSSHGILHTKPRETNIGALPYQWIGGVLHLVIVTSTSGQKWIVPKGQPESHLSSTQVAQMEAFEEGGIIGEVSLQPISNGLMDDDRILYLYPMQVTLLLDEWQEMKVRKRAVLPFDQAIKKLTDPAMKDCVREMSDMILEFGEL